MILQRLALTLTFLSYYFTFSIAQFPISPDMEWTGSINNGTSLNVVDILDFNGDGFDDVVVAVNTGGANTNIVHRIHYGSIDGLSGIHGWEVDEDFSTHDAHSGDYNNDGFDDLVFRSSSYDNYRGAIWVYLGGTNADNIADVFVVGTMPNGTFGGSIRGDGDINGDGYDDLIVSASNVVNDGLSDGRVYYFLGGIDGISAMRRDSILPTLDSHADFGVVINYLGDLNQDGYDKLGIRYGDEGRNYIEIFMGGDSGLDDIPVTINEELTSTLWQFGAAGDLNNDGYDDMYMGYSDKIPNLIKILYGSSSVENWTFEDIPMSHGDFSNLKQVRGIKDYNDDGFDDLIYKYDNTYYILNGKSGGLGNTPYYFYRSDATTSWLAAVRTYGDFNNDGFSDFILTNSGYDSPTMDNIGWVGVFYGEPSIIPAFETSANPFCPGRNITFHDITDSYSPITNWLWDFGDGQTSTEQHPVHEYVSGGVYFPELTVTNNLGQTSMIVGEPLQIHEPISGTVRVGGMNADYPDIEAFNADIQCGIVGDVIVLLANETFTTPLVLESIVHNGATLTFMPQDVSAPNPPMLQVPSDIYEPAVSIKNTSNVHFQNIDFNKTGSNVNYTINLESVENISFEKCHFYRDDSNQSFNLHIIGDTIQGLNIEQCVFDSYQDPEESNRRFGVLNIRNSSNLIINNNVVAGVENYVPGTYFNTCNNVQITNNSFPKLSIDADTVHVLHIENNDTLDFINAEYASSVTIANNQFFDSERPIELNQVEGLKVLSNRMAKLEKGIWINNCTGVTTDGFNLITNNVIGGELGGGNHSFSQYPNGVTITSSEGLKFYHNSILFDKNTYVAGTQAHGKALYIRNSNNIDVRNNAIVAADTVENTGVLFLVNNTNLYMDYNGYSGTNYNNYTNFEEFRANSQYDQHSFQTNIQFAGKYDLHLNEQTPALNSAAPALPEVPEDADGQSRATDFVDIGAYEFNAADVRDVAGQRIASGDLVMGTNTIEVVVSNRRSISIESLKLTYQLNNHPPVTETWTGQIEAFDSLIYTFQTPLEIDKGKVYDLKIIAELAEGIEDLNTSNDTITHKTMIPMMGTYLIGTDGLTDYEDISEASAAMKNIGIAGAITLEVQLGTNYNLVFSGGYNPTTILNVEDFPIVVRGLGENATSVICNNGSFAWVQNVRIENMTILPYNYPYNYPDRGMDMQGVNNIAFEKCIFKGDLETQYRERGFTFRTAENITIKDCHFENFITSISFTEIQTTEGIWSNIEGDITVENCTFNNITDAAIKIEAGLYFVHINLENNVISNVNKAIEIEPRYSNTSSLSIIKNHIFNSQEGLILNDIQCQSGSCPRNLVANNMIATSSDALFVSASSDPFDIVANSFANHVKVESHNSTISNNSFMNNGVSILTFPAVYQGDNNNFYSPNNDPITIHNGTAIHSIVELQNIYGDVEAHSTQHPPEYINHFDLHLQATSLLKNATTSIPLNLTTDIDGENRDATPDIGADECTGQSFQLDVGVIDIIPDFSTGIVEVIIRNFADAAVTGVEVEWSINGVLQTPFLLEEVIACNYHLQLAIGEYDFTEAHDFVITAWTHTFDYQSDLQPSNDTLELEFHPFSGNYTVGLAGDFSTISDALAAVYETELDGDVFFNLLDASYPESFNIYGDFSAIEAEHTVTFQAASGQLGDVIINANNGRGYVISLGASSNFRFKNLHFQPTGSDFIGIVEQYDGTDNIVFENNRFDANLLNTNPTDANLISLNDPFVLINWHGENTHRNHTIINNEFLKGDIGLERVYPVTPSSQTSFDRENKILNNTWTNQKQAAIHIEENIDFTVSGNIINATHQAIEEYTAIHLITTFHSDNTYIHNNQINRVGGGGYGIYFDASAAIGVQNFFIYNNTVSIETTQTIRGMYIVSSEGFYVHNSINIHGNASSSIAIEVENHFFGHDIANNTFNNQAGGLAYKSIDSYGNLQHNNFYTTGTALLNFNENIINFEDWNGGTAENNMSIEPGFVSNTDLHLMENSPLINQGRNVYYLHQISDDIDGELREDDMPDIGADEYISDIILPLVAHHLEGERIDDKVALQWTVSSTIGIKQFVIERMGIGGSWLPIGTKNVNELNTTFSFQDKEPLSSLTYYKIKIEYKDGTIGDSNTIHISSEKPQDTFHIFPNPIQQDIQVTLPKSLVLEEDTFIEVYNINGQKVWSEKIQGYNSLVNISSLPNGVYMLKVKNQTLHEQQMFLKQ